MRGLMWMMYVALLTGSCVMIDLHQLKKRRDLDEGVVVEGMYLGMCLSVVLASVLHFNVCLGIFLGLLVGGTFGISLQTSKNKDKKKMIWGDHLFTFQGSPCIQEWS